MHYRWNNPYEWLEEQSRSWDAEKLRTELLALAMRHDSDTLQDEYQGEMVIDGYFNEWKPTRKAR